MLIISITGLLIHASVVDGNWRWDDSQVIKHLLSHSVFASFIDPDTYASFSSTNLFPWILLSSRIDLALFGFSPQGFYLHQVLAIVLASLSLYLVCRQWMSTLFSTLTAILFLVGTPVAVISEQLMTRHYIEGLSLMLLALWFFTRYLQKSRAFDLALSVLSYALAVTAKEIYVPLLLLLPFIPLQNFRYRLIATVPFAAIAAVYSLWRLFMLQSALGGYTGSVQVEVVPWTLQILHSFGAIPGLLFPGSSWLVLLPALLIVVASIVGNRLRPTIGLLSLLLLLGPLTPLVIEPGLNDPGRYLLLVWVGFVFALGFFADRLMLADLPFVAGLRATTLAVFLTITVVAYANSRAYLYNSLYPVAAEYDAHAEFILGNGSESAYVPGPTILASYWYVTGLEDILAMTQGEEEIPVAVVDDRYLTAGLQTLHEYNGSCRCMSDISETIQGRIQVHRERLRPDAALSLSLRYANRILSWDFGPYDAGQYHVVSDRAGAYPLTTSGSIRASINEDIPFRARYTSPDGWITYSDELILRRDAPATVWERP